MLNINSIENKTLRKLNRHEIGALDLVNHGVMLYKGELKSLVRGFSCVRSKDGCEVVFTSNTQLRRYEFVKIEPSGEETEWAMRIAVGYVDPDELCWEYDNFLQPLSGLMFIR